MHFIMCLGFSQVLQETKTYQLLNFHVTLASDNIQIPAMQIQRNECLLHCEEWKNQNSMNDHEKLKKY